jgi:hypothetical protein
MTVPESDRKMRLAEEALKLPLKAAYANDLSNDLPPELAALVERMTDLPPWLKNGR